MNKRIPVATQLWSVKDDVATDLPRTLEQLAEMGYDGVETAGLGKTSTTQWKRLLADNNLVVSGAHVGLDALTPGAFEETIETYAEIGCRRFTVPALSEEYVRSLDGYRRACAMINIAASRAKTLGCSVGYHNHAFEFQFIENRIPFSLMLDCLTTDVEIQLDMGWVYTAGCDGAAYVRSLPGRIKTVHIKAFKPNDEYALVGEDTIPWQQVFAACEEVGGTEWYIVEHENYKEHTPMECVRRIRNNLRDMGKA